MVVYVGPSGFGWGRSARFQGLGLWATYGPGSLEYSYRSCLISGRGAFVISKGFCMGISVILKPFKAPI